MNTLLKDLGIFAFLIAQFSKLIMDASLITKEICNVSEMHLLLLLLNQQHPQLQPRQPRRPQQPQQRRPLHHLQRPLRQPQLQLRLQLLPHLRQLRFPWQLNLLLDGFLLWFRSKLLQLDQKFKKRILNNSSSVRPSPNRWMSLMNPIWQASWISNFWNHKESFAKEWLLATNFLFVGKWRRLLVE